VTPNAGNSIEQEQQLEERQRAADGPDVCLCAANDFEPRINSPPIDIRSSLDTGKT